MPTLCPHLQTLDALDEMLKVLVFESQASGLQQLQNILQVSCLFAKSWGGSGRACCSPQTEATLSSRGPPTPGTRHGEHAVG